jgi:hypothetical protein
MCKNILYLVFSFWINFIIFWSYDI